MELPIVDPSEVPTPSDEVRIRSLDVEPYPDGKRIRVQFELTPFQESPDIEAHARNIRGEILAVANIIGLTDAQNSFTLHLRDGEVTHENHVEISMSFPEIGEIDRVERSFYIPGNAPEKEA